MIYFLGVNDLFLGKENIIYLINYFSEYQIYGFENMIFWKK
jgi:hypothetical protein